MRVSNIVELSAGDSNAGFNHSPNDFLRQHGRASIIEVLGIAFGAKNAADLSCLFFRSCGRILKIWKVSEMVGHLPHPTM